MNSQEIDSVYTIPASISGEILAREVTLGEVIHSDDEALMIIANLSTLWIIASVPDTQMRFIQVGSIATITAAAIGDNIIEAKVSYIAPALDERTRTGQVRIEIPNGHNGLRPGMFGTAMISVMTDDNSCGQDVLSVPESAVFTVENSPAVFVLSKDKKILLRSG